MTTLNNAQSVELMKRTAVAINTKFPGLSFDRAELLKSAILEDFFLGEFVSENSDPIPSIGILGYRATCQLNKKGTGIYENKLIEKRNRTNERSAEDFNFVGETSSYSSQYYQTTSLDYLQEETDWEPATESYEQILINNTKTVEEFQREAFQNSPMFNGILVAAIKHVNEGGSFKSFAIKMGYASADTLKAIIKRRVEMSVDPKNTYLPFKEYLFSDIPKAKKAPRKTAKRKDTSVQLPLF